jgi:hypothetical protein
MMIDIFGQIVPEVLKALESFNISGTTRPVTLSHPEGFNHQQHCKCLSVAAQYMFETEDYDLLL